MRYFNALSLSLFFSLSSLAAVLDDCGCQYPEACRDRGDGRTVCIGTQTFCEKSLTCKKDKEGVSICQ